jgi:hypothetical protein
MNPGPDTRSKRYFAFISYTSSDASEAARLHHALESYRIPKRLRERATANDRTVPARLHPCFLDSAELPGVSTLSKGIYEGIEQSRSMVVVASAKACQSKWVDAEIRYAREQRVPLHVWVASGELPDVLPPAIIGEDVPAACNPGRTRHARRLALLRLVAGILDLELDELVGRDRERAKRRRRLIGAAAFAAIMASGLAYVQYKRDLRRIEATGTLRLRESREENDRRLAKEREEAARREATANRAAAERAATIAVVALLRAVNPRPQDSTVAQITAVVQKFGANAVDTVSKYASESGLTDSQRHLLYYALFRGTQHREWQEKADRLLLTSSAQFVGMSRNSRKAAPIVDLYADETWDAADRVRVLSTLVTSIVPKRDEERDALFDTVSLLIRKRTLFEQVRRDASLHRRVVAIGATRMGASCDSDATPASFLAQLAPDAFLVFAAQGLVNGEYPDNYRDQVRVDHPPERLNSDLVRIGECIDKASGLRPDLEFPTYAVDIEDLDVEDDIVTRARAWLASHQPLVRRWQALR